MLGADQTSADKLQDDRETDTDTRDSSDPERVGIAVHFLRQGKLMTETQVLGEVTMKRGSWTIVSEDGDRIEVEFQLESDETQKISVLFEDDNTVRMVPPNLAVLNREYQFNKR